MPPLAVERLERKPVETGFSGRQETAGIGEESQASRLLEDTTPVATRASSISRIGRA